MPRSVRGVMKEYGAGELHSGASTGPVVKQRSQAVAIALSEQKQRKALKATTESHAYNWRDQRRKHNK